MSRVKIIDNNETKEYDVYKTYKIENKDYIVLEDDDGDFLSASYTTNGNDLILDEISDKEYDLIEDLLNKGDDND